jgi:hypothetical protein
MNAEGGSDSTENDDTEGVDNTHNNDNTETTSVPESDLDDDGYVDITWPNGRAGTYRANLDGIGSLKAKKLAEQFDEFDDLIRASYADLESIEGIGRTTAKQIKTNIVWMSFKRTELKIGEVDKIDKKELADMFGLSTDHAESIQATVIVSTTIPVPKIIG